MGPLIQVCLNMFLFAYNVSRNKVYYRHLDSSLRYRPMTFRNGARKMRKSVKYNSIYAWLTSESQYYLLSPDSDEIFLPFRKKSQVYTMYMEAVEKEDGT